MSATIHAHARRAVAMMCAIGLIIALMPTAVAATPRPSSSLIDGFVSEIDDIYGYEMLRPSSWESLDLGFSRGYQPKGSTGLQNRVVLAVTNLKTLSDASSDPNSMIVNYEWFRLDPSLSPWMAKTEADWANEGIEYDIVRESASSRIYTVKHDPKQIDLVAYIVSQGQPLALSLSAFGTFAHLERLERTGLLADFETMVDSASAHLSTPQERATTQTSPGDSFSILSGPFHRDSGYISEGSTTWRFQTDYYQAPPRVYWMYEYYYYSGFQTNSAWLLRADVTDNPQNSCTFGSSWSLIGHPINKSVSPTTGVATDSFYPNQVVAHLNPTTAHAMKFSFATLIKCKWWYPY